jgi:hypothetical protein
MTDRNRADLSHQVISWCARQKTRNILKLASAAGRGNTRNGTASVHQCHNGFDQTPLQENSAVRYGDQLAVSAAVDRIWTKLDTRDRFDHAANLTRVGMRDHPPPELRSVEF